MAFLHILGDVLVPGSSWWTQVWSCALCRAGQSLQGFARCVAQSKVCIPVVTVLAKVMCHSTVFVVKTLIFAVPAGSASSTGRRSAEEKGLSFLCPEQKDAECTDLNCSFLGFLSQTCSGIQGEGIASEHELPEGSWRPCCSSLMCWRDLIFLLFCVWYDVFFQLGKENRKPLPGAVFCEGWLQGEKARATRRLEICKLKRSKGHSSYTLSTLLLTPLPGKA